MKVISENDLSVLKRSFDVLPHLDTEKLGRIIEIHERLSSTNDRASRLAKDGAVHGVTVVALEQTEGRGQHGRRWHSPPGAGLYVSFVIRPTLSPRLTPAITILSGVAVRDALQSTTSTKLEVKWPNDVLVAEGEHRHKKLAGILVEATSDSFKIDHAVIGIGVNLDRTALPDELKETAVSLEELDAIERSPENILGKVAGALERRLDQAVVDGLAPIARDFTRHAFMLSQKVVVKADGETIEGTLAGIAEDGALLVDTLEGVKTLYRGELQLDRPDPNGKA